MPKTEKAWVLPLKVCTEVEQMKYVLMKHSGSVLQLCYFKKKAIRATALGVATGWRSV